MSTAYVNCNRPHGSHVEERLYSFSGDKAVTHSSRSSRQAELDIVEKLAAELAALPESAASQQVSTSIQFLAQCSEHVGKACRLSLYTWLANLLSPPVH